METPRAAVNEELLRECVLKAYHENRSRGKEAKRALDGIRQFLSGAPGGVVARGYWFEQDPASSAKSLVVDLEAAKQGLAALVFETVLAQFAKARQEGATELALNLSVFLSSVGGAVAVKADIDEALACGLVATVMIGVSVAGESTFNTALEEAAGSKD